MRGQGRRKAYVSVKGQHEESCGGGNIMYLDFISANDIYLYMNASYNNTVQEFCKTLLLAKLGRGYMRSLSITSYHCMCSFVSK